MIAILIFSGIHLGISIGIIDSSHQYGNIFRREQDLSIFNIIIGILGIIISLFGLFALITRRVVLSKITAGSCLFLSLCALVSLIAAIAINFGAASYIGSHFLNNMKRYDTSAHARNSIDNIQRNYDCCGHKMWIDWATISSDATLSNIDKTTSSSTTISSDMNVPPKNGDGRKNSKSKTTPETESSTTSNIITNYVVWPNSNSNQDSNEEVQQVPSQNSKPEIQIYPVSKTAMQSNNPSSVYRVSDRNPQDNNAAPSNQLYYIQKRQIQSNHPNIDDISSPFNIFLPESCCANRVSTVFNSFDSYCVSSADDTPSSYHKVGCSNRISKVAAHQTTSIAIINVCLLIFALVAIPVVKTAYSNYESPPKKYRNSSIQSQQFHYGYSDHAVFNKTPKTSVINYNTDYSIFQ
ncbi:unnamed protein product [Adineta steineri]|uniref:Uncharacterized protein n=1 Tax=Adineta steineri TaxID=433720 RepID=A0A813UQU7_9BILA|nr:unnamed protein product [Adineta steineri]